MLVVILAFEVGFRQRIMKHAIPTGRVPCIRDRREQGFARTTFCLIQDHRAEAFAIRHQNGGRESAHETCLPLLYGQATCQLSL